jgi:hypothetical protein
MYSGSQKLLSHRLGFVAAMMRLMSLDIFRDYLRLLTSGKW